MTLIFHDSEILFGVPHLTGLLCKWRSFTFYMARCTDCREVQEPHSLTLINLAFLLIDLQFESLPIVAQRKMVQ